MRPRNDSARRARARTPVSAFAAIAAFALVLVASPLSAQAPGAAAAVQAGSDAQSALATALAQLATPGLPRLPEAAAFVPGPRTIAASERVAGPVAVASGNVDVSGTVTGDVVTFGGNITVHAGASVTGNAIAIGGTVQAAGGTVLGQTMELTPPGAAGRQAAATPANRIGRQLAIVGGWFAILIVISVGVLLLAGENLAAVADALERHYGTTLVAGLAGQVAFAPLLVAILVALVLSLIGILLVPFAAVAYVIIAAGLVTLGFLGTAVVVGRGWRAAPPGSDLAQRAATLRALVVGVTVLLSPWAVAALLAPWPAAESLARGAAFATSWVACTAGLGAALVSRAGIRRASSSHAQRAMAASGWQTPTPVSGVVAARRPAATPTAAGR